MVIEKEFTHNGHLVQIKSQKNFHAGIGGGGTTQRRIVYVDGQHDPDIRLFSATDEELEAHIKKRVDSLFGNAPQR